MLEMTWHRQYGTLRLKNVGMNVNFMAIGQTVPSSVWDPTLTPTRQKYVTSKIQTVEEWLMPATNLVAAGPKVHLQVLLNY